MAKLTRRAKDRVFDDLITGYVDEFHRLKAKVGHDQARIAVINRVPSGMQGYVDNQINASSGSVAKPQQVRTKARVQSAPTIKVYLAATGDRDEFREVRMPPSGQFKPRDDIDMCRMAYVMSYVPATQDEDAKQVTTNRNGRKIERMPYYPPKVADGDLIYLPNGKVYVIRNKGRDFVLLTSDQISWYLSWPQSHRKTHPLLACGK